MDVSGDLERFVLAQEASYDEALAELRAGRKTSHWMWFIFPQLQGLGQSAMAQLYALRDLGEAVAYWSHPVLGPRLRACADALLRLQESDPVRVLGSVDAVKLRSSMTLFLRATGEPVFGQVLAQYYDNTEDPATLVLL